jgi:hypothetical protein
MLRIVAVSFFIVVAFLTTPVHGTAQSRDLVLTPSQSNNFRIYISPARHSDAGRRGECDGKNENTMAFASAFYVARGPSNSVYDGWELARGLVDRGFMVRIGTGNIESAIQNSNMWGADLHIVMHSNANVGSINCDAADPQRFGTVVIYRASSTQGHRLAELLVRRLGPLSPGRTDYACPNPGHSCTQINLGELRRTNAVASYIESEFHSWRGGMVWLERTPDWAWHVAAAIDEFLGYPSRRIPRG